MVVIGIIAILGAVVVPGFKKIYSDFKINETYTLLDSIFSSMRSYYLIFNEKHAPIDGTPWYAIDERLISLLSPLLKKFVGKFDKVSFGYNWYYFTPYRGFYLFYQGKTIQNTFVLGRFRLNKEYNGNGDMVIERLYYWNDLLERYQNKGYTTYENGFAFYIYPPEYTEPEVTWFR